MEQLLTLTKGFTGNLLLTYRDYNEDRVKVMLNIPSPKLDIDWPIVNYFAVFDGHGGSNCVQFVQENLHEYIFTNKHFPQDVRLAISESFFLVEQKFKEISNMRSETSGTCVCMVITVDNDCYVVNLGDSRAVYSESFLSKLFYLTTDHKPSNEAEKARIQYSGGRIYQYISFKYIRNEVLVNGKSVMGPVRVEPGNLSVSRALGDFDAKLPELGGKPNIVISSPEIISFKLTTESDCLIIACN